MKYGTQKLLPCHMKSIYRDKVDGVTTNIRSVCKGEVV